MAFRTDGLIRHIEPGDQVPSAGLVSNALFYVLGTGASGSGVNNIGSLRLPAYTIASLSGTLRWGSGLEVSFYVKNLFDENPKLSIDRERGLRARFGYLIGKPRTIGLTVRQSFGRHTAVLPPPPSPAATQTCPDGSVIGAAATCPVPLPPPPPPPPPPTPAPERG